MEREGKQMLELKKLGEKLACHSGVRDSGLNCS
jgi:hypothetical protein